MAGAHDDVPACLCVADRVVQLLLEEEGLVELLKIRDEVDQGQDNEDGDEELSSPVAGREVSIANCEQRYHRKPVGVKERDLQVDALKVVYRAYTVCVSVCKRSHDLHSESHDLHISSMHNSHMTWTLHTIN